MVTTEDYPTFFVGLPYSETGIHLEINVSSGGNVEDLNFANTIGYIFCLDVILLLPRIRGLNKDYYYRTSNIPLR